MQPHCKHAHLTLEQILRFLQSYGCSSIQDLNSEMIKGCQGNRGLQALLVSCDSPLVNLLAHDCASVSIVRPKVLSFMSRPSLNILIRNMFSWIAIGQMENVAE
jgi:hypothetical protein